MAGQHASRQHALLSASGSSRWLNCTPSARLEEKFDEASASSYAQEGTLAHEIADVTLNHYVGNLDTKAFNREMKKLTKRKFYSEEMVKEVAKYVEAVTEIHKETLAADPNTVMSIEETLDYSNTVPKGTGTGDNIICGAGKLFVIDLKFGKGIKVETEDNSQLKLYGIGALNAYDLEHDIKEVILIIVQPRMDHFSVTKLTPEELMKWGEVEVKPKALKAYEGKGKQQAGEWCRFCKVKGMCATLAARNIRLAQHEFKDPHFLPDDVLIEVYKQIPMLTMWAGAVGEYVLKEALSGKKWSGLKAIPGRKTRSWVDDEQVLETLSLLVDETDVTDRKLKSVTAVEKLIGKTEFKNLMEGLFVESEGSPKLVPESHPTPAINSADQAKIDFS